MLRSDFKLLITPGEPAGIGPDLVIMAAGKNLTSGAVIVADPDLLMERAKSLGLKIKINDYSSPGENSPGENRPGENRPGESRPGEINVIPVSLKVKSQAGSPDPKNASYVINCLSRATELCLEKKFAGIVTGPIQKSTINEAGIPFKGHTEWLADKTGVSRVVMMLTTAKSNESKESNESTATPLRVALATTHLPLRLVADSISDQLLTEVITILHADLGTRFGIPEPRILVCGLNPHAGEGGYLGREEIEIIKPALHRLKSQGINVSGPFPADTLFTPKYLQNADVVLAMYHDQGLPVLKHLGFGSAANITLGLPIIRTSVDHGTALELAGTGNINCGSIKTALRVAEQMVVAQAS